MIGDSLLWLLVLELFGIAAFPIAYRAFSKMPDRGWAFSKPLGLVFVGFGTWVIGLTHTVPNSRWTVLLALAIVLCASWASSRSSRDELVAFLRRNVSTIFTAELLFIAVFLGMTLFRATVTSIGATEQPMDLMLLNAVTTSPYYPPTDPWLAGEPISYYYLGYLMLGTVTMLAGIATPIAYNLGLATAAAMGGIAAFGVAFNLVRLARGSDDGAVFAGITAAFLLLFASNLVGTLELVRAAGIGDEGFWAAVGINGLTAPDGPAASWRPDESHLWWWRASRVVPPAHINEFPLFSFLVGDLHPHVMSMGFVLLTVGTSIQLYLQQGLIRFRDKLGGLAGTISLLAAVIVLLWVVDDVNILWTLPILAVAAAALLGPMWPLGITVFISTGALAAMNLWDLPLGLALVVGAILLGTARNERSFGFGAAIDVSGPRLISGAPNDSTLALASGAAILYGNTDGHWEKEATFRPFSDAPYARFGAAVAVDRDIVVVGAPGAQAAMVYQQVDDQWSPSKKFTSQWRLGPSIASSSLLVAATFMAFMPFFSTFDSNASGVLPLLSLLTRPLHLALLWGVAGLLVLPFLAIALKSVFVVGSWNTKRFGVAFFGGFTPIALWLQPVWALPLLIVLVLVFALHQAGYRMARADESTFAYNPKATLAVGSIIIVGGLLWDAIKNVERGTGGELLAVDRLLVTVPMAIVISLAVYGAWTIAHRDSEVLRTANDPTSAQTKGDALAPALGLLAVAGALVMGVELFHVVDIFGGDYRRINTMFKLNYQAWQLFSVLGGFAVWFVTTRWNRKVLSGRIGITVWTALLLITLGAISYYPLAAITSLAGDTGALDLDGQSHIKRNAPAEYAAIQWIKGNTPADAVIVEAAVVPCAGEVLGCHSYTDAARISGSTGRPTIIGWIGHERQWRRAEMHADLDRRLRDVRLIFETTDATEAAALLARYDADYVVVGPRERNAYGTQGERKFAEFGSPVFTDLANGQNIVIYEIAKSTGTQAAGL
ncbi:MAG: DUF2298 domain-containing protein [Chloroflexi bacterium]|nr:DUF2298 domain-containing protein [Chloroflexota bacterium]MDA1173045.1 DUF2298 domain-containing protein [Chloroflexota bacterium]